MKIRAAWSLGVIALALLLPVIGAAQDPLDTWTWRNPLPQGIPLGGVAYGNNTFVAVGSSGTIITSPDGVTWTQQVSGTTDSLYAVTYANNTFVAVGGGGPNEAATILTSADGITWTSRTSGATQWLQGVTYGNNTFVAVGWRGTILTSPDGVTWTPRSAGTTAYLYLNGIAYGNNTFVAFGCVGVDSIFLTSPDGVTWTRRAAGTIWQIHDIAYGNNAFVAVAGPPYRAMASSSDSPAEDPGAIFTSPDGVTWQTQSSGIMRYLSGITYANNIFVAVGNLIITSPDGTTWTSRSSETANWLLGVAYGNNTFVAVGLATAQSGLMGAYAISGSVKDISNVPIQGATITVKDASKASASTTTTDSSGNYTAYLTSAGEYSVTATKPGYEMYSFPEAVVLDATHAATTVSAIYMELSVASFLITLSAGWNFVSTPIQPQTMNIAAVLQEISQNVRIVWAYDGESQSWQAYKPSGMQNTLQTIEAGKGYWIYVSSAATLAITGVLSSAPIHLYEQWNLIGYKGTNGTAVTATFLGISNKWRVIWSWDNGQWYVKDPVRSELPVPTLTALYQGRAYWVKMKQGQATDWTQGGASCVIFVKY